MLSKVKGLAVLPAQKFSKLSALVYFLGDGKFLIKLSLSLSLALSLARARARSLSVYGLRVLVRMCTLRRCRSGKYLEIIMY